ncbi:DUF2147 domain-containing protein [Pikeienuella piscinae]|uniref:DUF2147 domain-containing protein n=1 Tax=Pikeienuella piscinae TaxID=2748098 RepID=A0A7L5BYJ4_9RHOB|nr:DUF2147 domain-containing protein [Pikeienuella piscinae]QIE56995.1 DUF2147 domain-containing protein [Pikeienuella piscinae]
MKLKTAVAALIAALTSAAAATADPTGLWKTEANDEGSYLVVDIGPCADRLCGVIVDARDKAGISRESYENLGRQIITDMAPDGANKWDDGEIWAPDEDKTYSASMELNGDVLEVEGCLLVFCRGQNWTRAE